MKELKVNSIFRCFFQYITMKVECIKLMTHETIRSSFIARYHIS